MSALTIPIYLDDGETQVSLTRVDHLTTPEEAARALWESLYEVSKVHGGSATLINPEDHRWPHHAVRWQGGPKQWAQAFSVSEGSTAPEFVTVALDDYTVGFVEADA